MKLFFGQHANHKRMVNMELREFPHYKYLAGDKQSYIDYLKLSNHNIKEKLERYDKLIESSKKEGIKTPIIITTFNNRKVIYDGNHRASISLFFNIDLPIVEITPEKYISRIVRNKARYGTGDKKIPYQSIYYKGKELVKGRRDDLVNRMKFIDVMGKDVVDIGCNYGTSCFLAKEKGAKSVRGFDINEGLINSALKINNLFEYDVGFNVGDFSKVQDVTGDVAFCFSVDKHIKNDEALYKNLKNFKEVYFETHQHSKIPKVIKDNSKQELLTKLGDRKLYRLVWM